MNQLNLANY